VGFILSKVIAPLATPSNLIALAMLLGGLLALTGWRRFGRRLLGLGVVAVLAVMVLPIGGWITVPLEQRFAAPAALPEQVDGIVVLGGGVTKSLMPVVGGAQLNEAADRFAALVILARRYPAARIVYSGGNATLAGGAREADAVAALLGEMGIDASRIVFEREARTTYENAVLTKTLMSPQPGETWLLVTSAMHMPRAVGAFRRQGWAPIPLPVDFATAGELHVVGLAGSLADALGGIDRAAHEWVGLVAYRLFGYSDSLFPGPIQ
jgi:uncharacterized SAM-binding protein YcdF (DUF218 family)